MKQVRSNLSLNPDASPAALRAVRSAPVSFVRQAANRMQLMEFLGRLARLPSSERLLSHWTKRVEESPDNFVFRLCVADIYWRKREWQIAIEHGLHALRSRPLSFQALMIVFSSYAHLGETDKALPYAHRLLAVPLPRWAAVKFAVIVISMRSVFRRTWRERLRRALQSCDRERKAELAHLSRARELVDRNASSKLGHVAA